MCWGSPEMIVSTFVFLTLSCLWLLEILLVNVSFILQYCLREEISFLAYELLYWFTVYRVRKVTLYIIMLVHLSIQRYHRFMSVLYVMLAWLRYRKPPMLYWFLCFIYYDHSADLSTRQPIYVYRSFY